MSDASQDGSAMTMKQIALHEVRPDLAEFEKIGQKIARDVEAFVLDRLKDETVTVRRSDVDSE